MVKYKNTVHEEDRQTAMLCNNLSAVENKINNFRTFRGKRSQDFLI